MEPLFRDFAPATAADWKARLEKDLKGVTFGQLSVTDRNGFTIYPFYTREDRHSLPAPVTTRPGWSICTRIEVSDAAAANRRALEELNQGASGLCFVLEQDTDPAVLLREIGLPYIYTCFYLEPAALPFAGRLSAYIAQQGWAGSVSDAFIAFDVVERYIRTGAWVKDQEQDLAAFDQLSVSAEGLHTLCIDATLYQNTGANTTYELACAIAHVNEYLNRLSAQQQLSRLNKIQVALATDTGFFEQIAKLRAFRSLLSQLFAAYDIHPELQLHAETSNVYRSPFDSYSNLLRDSVAGMAAVLGGCNSLYIHPFDEALKTPDAFSIRMSRNQQLIFKEESYLDKVADVAAGSYYLETLTEEIAAGAWALFQEIESLGGLIAAFDQGIIRETINLQAAELIAAYREGKKVLIGVNKFPNPKDEPAPHTPAPEADNKGLRPLRLSEHIL